MAFLKIHRIAEFQVEHRDNSLLQNIPRYIVMLLHFLRLIHRADVRFAELQKLT